MRRKHNCLEKKSVDALRLLIIVVAWNETLDAASDLLVVGGAVGALQISFRKSCKRTQLAYRQLVIPAARIAVKPYCGLSKSSSINHDLLV